jgi:hypothetical protein
MDYSCVWTTAVSATLCQLHGVDASAAAGTVGSADSRTRGNTACDRLEGALAQPHVHACSRVCAEHASPIMRPGSRVSCVQCWTGSWAPRRRARSPLRCRRPGPSAW